MIRFINQTKSDVKKLATLNYQTIAAKSRKIDYSKYIINKPWGYEYLIYENGKAAVWILYIKKGHQTSMHAHLTKKTSMTVLSGQIEVRTLEKKLKLNLGEGILIENGTFHSTGAKVQNVVLMEIESPVNKHDLVRLYDSYGRENFGYEGKKFYEYINFDMYESFKNGASYNNLKKFGEKYLKIVGCSHTLHLAKGSSGMSVELACLLWGNMRNKSGDQNWTGGDLVDSLYLKDDLNIDSWVELLLVGKIDDRKRII